MRVRGPSTGPTACALAGRRCAPWGWRKGVPGGGAVRRCEGRLGSVTLLPPTARPLGRLPGPTTHWLWVRVRGDAGVGTRHQPHGARSCELALRAVGVPGGGASCLGVGVRGRALSHPQLPALWAGCRGPLPTGCGCGGVRVWGPVTNPTARALASCTYDFSSCFFPKFNKSAKRGFSREMTYFFGFYGPKIGGGGPPTRVLSKKIKNPEIWPILGYFCLLWAGPAEQCCTPVYLPIEDFRQKFQFSLDSLAPK